MKGLLGLLFVLLFALLLNVKLWFFPLFFVTFVFLSNVTHDNYSFLVGLSPQMTDFTCMHSAISQFYRLSHQLLNILENVKEQICSHVSVE
jgi:hypothetical protein